MIKEELKKYRAKEGYTQEKLALELEMDKTSYCKRENGLIDFSLQEIKKIAEVLKMTGNDILRIFFEIKVA